MRHTDINVFRPVSDGAVGLRQLNERSREVFKRIVETYLATGDPVGSRNLSRALPMTLSPASVRNVMSDLEELGLIYAPHTSAGRLPTQSGLRLFVDGLLEIGEVSEEERSQIEARIAGDGRHRAVEEFLAEAGAMLSGLSRCAGVVLVDKQSKTLKQVEFVNLGPGRALAVLVSEDGDVENRIVALPEGLPLGSLTRGLELHQRTHRRPHARRGTRPHRERDRAAARPARRAHRTQSSPKGSPPGRAAGMSRRASSSVAARISWRTCGPWRIWNGCGFCSRTSTPRRT